MPPDRSQRDASAIRDMVDAMDEATMHVSGLPKDTAGVSPQPRDAALYRVLVLGEAASRVSSETRLQHPEVPWAEIVGMRNILIHGYEKVDWDVVWQSIHTDFLELKPRLMEILRALG